MPVTAETLISYADGIHAIDACYVRPRLAAIHLIVERGRAAFFDTGTTHSLPQVRAALARLGLAAEAVDYVIPSHVHLDHAGGAGAMMRAFPNATLVVHPRGARHLIDPQRLLAGTVGVYGAERTRELYGEVIPVDAVRVHEAADGMVLALAGRPLTLYHTPGHARHHICLHDGRSGALFAGDMLGLSYRELDRDGRTFVFPTTTPIQFEPEAMRESIRRLAALEPCCAYLTHFSRVDDVPALVADLLRLVDAHVELARLANRGTPAERHLRLVEALWQLLREEKARHGWTLDDRSLRALFAGDLELNAQGLEVWLDDGG
jgi:glyoxylase-like metal-dependent hydrolase (beta-lactamase superfamily II)